MTTNQEQELISLAQQGDSQALSSLYQHYLPAIYRFFYWQTNHQQQIAEDLTSQTFLEMIKSLKSFRREASFKNWLYQIAKNLLAGHLRRHYQLPTQGLFDYLPDCASIIDPELQTQKSDQLHHLLQQLATIERTVITARYLENQSVKEVAAKYQLSVSNVKVITHRSLTKLRQLATVTS